MTVGGPYPTLMESSQPLGPFHQLAEYGYGDVYFRLDAASQLRAIVAIHDTRLGPALGGTRIVSYSNERAGMIDALRLARAMTSKAALAGLKHGGGKAVILLPPAGFDRAALFRSFGRFVADLGGRYITTEDSGTSPDDMEIVRSQTKHVCGFDVRSGGSGDPSPFTALGVRRGIQACVQWKLGRSELSGVHVAVQGVGNVGYYLCRELHGLGARLSVADVRPEGAARVAREFGATVVDSAEIHRVECDVYAPCALGGAIDEHSLPELRCAIVAGGANNQLADDAAGVALHQKGVLYAPDYAINAGGLINVAQEVAGYDPDRARTRTLAIYDTILQICERSKAQDSPPHRIADALVAELLERATKAA
jgi:leucine dehydrogenase